MALLRIVRRYVEFARNGRSDGTRLLAVDKVAFMLDAVSKVLSA